MKKRGLTWAQQQKVRHDCNRALIMRLCGISEYQYFWMIVEAGMEFIKTTSCGEYDTFQKEVVYNKKYYWPWFSNQWKIADAEFIFQYKLDEFNDEPIAEATHLAIKQAYEQFHADWNGSAQMERGYDLTISQLIKNIHAKATAKSPQTARV